MKINIKKYVIIFAVLASLLVLASFFDLQISKSIADLDEGRYISSNLFGRFFETIGSTPVYLASAFALSIIFHNLFRRERTLAKKILMVLAVIISVGLLTYMSKQVFGYIADHFAFKHKLGAVTDWIAYFLMGSILTFGIIWFTQKLSSKFLNNALAWAFIILITALFSQVITQGIKSFWGRARFRTMNAIGDFSLYTDWFKFVPKRKPDDMMLILGVASDGFKSFPSGHATSSAILIVLTALPQIISALNNKKCKIIINVCVFVFIALSMFSRILVGAHFLSDVVLGAIITTACYLISTLIINKVLSKHQIKPLKAGKLNYRLQEESIN